MALKVKIVDESPLEKSRLYVGWDSFEIGTPSLWTSGIGSCLALALYDPTKKIGALAHITGIRDRKIVPEAVFPEYLVRSMVAEFGVYQHLEAALAGDDRICTYPMISPIVKEQLAMLNIPIIGEDLGYFAGTRGREVHFDCQTGEVTIYRLPPLQF